MSEQLHDRVTDLLERADDQSGSLVAGSAADDESDADGETMANDFQDLAAEANDLLDSSAPDELLAAVGLETLPDGTEPDSIPEAIAQGDPDAVEDLRRLLHLARLADHGDGLEDAIGSVRAGIGDAGAADSDDAVEAESEAEPSDESGESAAAEDSSDTESDEATSDAEDATSDLEERLRSAMTSSLTDFSDDVSQLQERLESLGSGDGGNADESDSAAEPDESAADEAESEAEPVDEASDESDDGLLETDLGSGGDRGTSGSGTRYSTMAPPPSKRADMRGTARFSTIPGKIRD